jgi:putative restriction endonuclease
MRFVVLTSRPGSPYADTTRSYEYPLRYRRYFDPLANGEPMMAIIYGPADSTARRMAFIGWAALSGAPTPSPRKTPQGHPQLEVRYVDDIQYFPNPVPFRLMGESMERWVREWPSGSPDMRGRSVRDLEEDDARRILELGYAGSRTFDEYQVPSLDAPTTLAAERTKRLIEAAARDSRFRKSVMTAYGYRCAVTGLSAEGVDRRQALRLLDAAHIRPVSDQGPDIVGNGLSLTPTVHRLFDEGLISAAYGAAGLELLVSPQLDTRMVHDPERGTIIRLDPGAHLLLPGDPVDWPKRDVIRYHSTHVFQGPAN